ncbi:MAG: LysR family transcriptional regulator [Ghiorsea sp.]|nr:LysR family transcriptional regulator [Ghiorsea sp.]
MFIETRHLRSLQAIAQSRSLAHAAAQLYVTQSALSHQIKSLETHFNTKLFLRGCKPLRLTLAGQRLVDLAQQVLPEITQAEYELSRMAGGELGRLHITIECHACFEWLIGTLDTYRQQWPDIEVDLRMGMSFDAIPSLSQGEIDLVISSDPIKTKAIVFEPLFPYEGRLAIAPDHALAMKTYIQPTDLINETLITYPVPHDKLDIFKGFLTPAGIEPHAVRHAELTAMMLQLVASKRGVAALPDWVLHDSIQSGRITSAPLGQHGLHGMLYAAIRKADQHLDFVQSFMTLAAQAVHTMK